MDSTKGFWKRFLKGSNDRRNSTGMMSRWMKRGRNHHHNSPSICVLSTTPPLKKDLLPIEALEKVLAYLPLPALFRARCVCKSWRALIASPRFLKVRSAISSTVMQPYFPMVFSRSYGRQCFAFDFIANKWQKLAPLDFVPYKVAYVAGAGGLLCLRNCFELLVVCNPITRQWKNLPRSTSHLGIGQCMIHMIVDPTQTTNAYKIITISGACKIEVYDSAIQEWTMTSQSLSHGVTCIRGQTAAFCNGFLYCIVDEGIGSKMSGVIAYDTQLAVWSTMLIMLPLGFGEARSSNSLQPRSLSASLVECGGHVMLVAEKLQLGVTLVHLFELQLMSITWRDVATLPFESSTPGFESFRHGLRCDGVVVHEHCICLTSQCGDMVVLDMVQNKWSALPSCPLFQVGKPADIDIAVFPFIPSLETSM